MIEMTLAEVAEAVSGHLIAADPSAVVTGPVEYDSRLVAPGGLFVAFPGERVDGHDYAAAAHAAGAVAVLATRPLPPGAQPIPTVLVDDARTAMSALAHAVAARLTGLTIVGLTGSSGKTTTKDMVAQLLVGLGRTVAPTGSLNNELGYPYTVLRAGADTRYLALELGARGLGHIRYLCGIARPHIGLVLNVGVAHLGEFGTVDAIAQAKGELVEALPAGGLAVLNADDPRVRAMAARTGARSRCSATWPSSAGTSAPGTRRWGAWPPSWAWICWSRSARRPRRSTTGRPGYPGGAASRCGWPIRRRPSRCCAVNYAPAM